MYLYFLCCSRISPSPSVWLTSRENTWFASVTSGVCLWFYHRRKSESHVTQPHVKDCCSVGETDSGLQSNGHVMKYKPVIRLSTQTLLQKLWLLVKSDLFHWRRAETNFLWVRMCTCPYFRHTFGLYSKSVVCWGVTVWWGVKESRSTQRLFMPSEAPSCFIKLSTDRVDASRAANLHPTSCVRWSWFFAVLPKKWGWKICMNHASSQHKTHLGAFTVHIF